MEKQNLQDFTGPDLETIRRVVAFLKAEKAVSAEVALPSGKAVTILANGEVRS